MNWRLLSGAVAILAPPFALWIDLRSGLQAGWAPTGAAQALYPALSVALGLAVLAILVPITRRIVHRHLASIVLFAASLGIGLGLAELVAAQFRILPVEALFHRRSPYKQHLYRPAPEVMPGVEGLSQYSVNRYGFRADEIPRRRDTPRVLCIGGSTTECLYLDQSETWPALLQDALREQLSEPSLWVGNAGYSGYGTSHHLALVQHAEIVLQTDCLVFLVGMNDFMLELRGFDFARPQWNPRGQVRPLVAETALGRLVRTFAQKTKPVRRQGAELIEDVVGASYIDRREDRSVGRRIPLPNLDEAVARYRERIRAIASLCRARRTRCIFLTQPVLWDDGLSAEWESLLWLGYNDDDEYVDVPELRAGMDRYNAALIEECAELGVECVDLSGMSGDARFYYDDCHLNEAGAAEVARRLAEHFAEAGP